ncbi:hypothetical protein [Escherichia phage EP_H11]|nr:hypothetical protein [Escherichia phage EP_H11]
MKKILAVALLAVSGMANASVNIECFGPDGRVLYSEPNAQRYVIETAATTIIDSSGNPVVITAAAPCIITPNK